ncbi:MAG: helix-turn-helix domain-containing protein [Phycisphaerales bacterium]|nr:helix-turn-helix domain-containing protein [Phycisphaerales bacterium]
MSFSPEWLPVDPPRIAPALMTAREAAAYLRLDDGDRDPADAIKSLEYLVRDGRIRPCRVGKHNRYARAELDRFILEQTESYGREAGRNGSTSAGSLP